MQRAVPVLEQQTMKAYEASIGKSRSYIWQVFSFTYRLFIPTGKETGRVPGKVRKWPKEAYLLLLESELQWSNLQPITSISIH